MKHFKYQFRPKANPKSVGARLRFLRRELFLTQEEVARLAGVSRPSLVNMESGRQGFSVEMLERLAAALGVSMKAVMKGIWW